MAGKKEKVLASANLQSLIAPMTMSQDSIRRILPPYLASTDSDNVLLSTVTNSMRTAGEKLGRESSKQTLTSFVISTWDSMMLTGDDQVITIAKCK